MPPVPKDPRALFIENVIGSQQFANSLDRQVERLLNDMLGRVNSTLVTDYADLTQFQRRRLLTLFRRTEKTIQKSYKEIQKLVNGELFNFASVQGAYAERVLQTTVFSAGVELDTTSLTLPQIKNIVDLPVQGLPLGRWWKSEAANMSRRFRRTVQLGLMQGQTTPQIVRQIMEVRPGAPSLLSRGRASARALVRTSITAVSSETQFETFKAQDDDITDSYQYVATLDEKTTVVCGSLDGQVFKYSDQAAPRPPQHINCRSTIIPVVNWQKLGVTPTDEMLDLQRASMHGPVKFKNYESWLRAQPAAVQDRTLGKGRGLLFRRDKVSLKRMLRDNRTPLTVKELSEKLGVSPNPN